MVVSCFNDLSIAPHPPEESRQLRITHPFHPLKSKQFELVEYRCIYGEGYLYFHDERGQLREIPGVWTDFVKADVFVELAAGRSFAFACPESAGLGRFGWPPDQETGGMMCKEKNAANVKINTPVLRFRSGMSDEKAQ
jgi:hypothetical protein